ncbi:MAG: hypothetical protein IJ436_07985 [Bacteroidaceae bacterium]|nr:hypothetical protein [Bacteroidaceae bacterium]
MNTNVKKALLLLVVAILGICTSKAIEDPRKKDPLIITGALGTQSTLYYSSGGSFASPLNYSMYANMNVNLYGYNMPFAFYYSCNNYSFSHPQFAFNFSPTYKGWTLHVGRRSMPFSAYVYNLPFNGLGIEYKSPTSGFRFGLFYGILREAVNFEPGEMPSGKPVYKRSGWGLKVGYGSTRNFVDLYLFRSQDHQSSIDDIWYEDIFAQENIVLGLRGRWQIFKQLSLTGNVASSIFSTDTKAPQLTGGNTDKYDDLFDIRYTSLMRWAGDLTLAATFRTVSLSLFYKLIQPDYMSMGVSYMNNNYHNIGTAANLRLGNLSLAGNFSFQEDNISGEQLYTTRGLTYSLNASVPVGNKVSLSANYNGFRQCQYDGTAHVNDTTRINRSMNSFSGTASYNTNTESLGHYFSLTGNYSINEDKNKTIAGTGDVGTLAVGSNYSLSVIPIETNFSFNYSYQQSDGYDSKYTTSVYTLSASKALLKNRNLSLNASASLVDNRMDSDQSITMAANLSTAYTLAKVHNFTLNLNYSRYTNTNLVLDEYQRDKGYDFTCSFSYSFSFTAFSIKRRAKEEITRYGKYEYYSDFSRSAVRERQMLEYQKQKNNENRQKMNSVEASAF